MSEDPPHDRHRHRVAIEQRCGLSNCQHLDEEFQVPVARKDPSVTASFRCDAEFDRYGTLSGTHRSPATATTEFLGPDILGDRRRAVPAQTQTLGRTLTTNVAEPSGSRLQLFPDGSPCFYRLL